MTERIDHSSKAVKMLALNANFLSQEGDEIHALGNTLEAHVHATLALVEQQRIANIIAYWQLHTPRSTEEDGFIEVRVLHGAGEVRDVDTIVREGLGL